MEMFTFFLRQNISDTILFVLHGAQDLFKFAYCCDQGKLVSPYMQKLLINSLSQQVSNFARN